MREVNEWAQWRGQDEHRDLTFLPMGSLRRGLPPGWWHAEGVGVVWLRRNFATPTWQGYGGPGAWFPEWITPGGAVMPSPEADPRIRKEYSASVSNPPSPFVDMMSGVQSTAASERSQPCPPLPPPPRQLPGAARPG